MSLFLNRKKDRLNEPILFTVQEASLASLGQYFRRRIDRQVAAPRKFSSRRGAYCYVCACGAGSPRRRFTPPRDDTMLYRSTMITLSPVGLTAASLSPKRGRGQGVPVKLPLMAALSPVGLTAASLSPQEGKRPRRFSHVACASLPVSPCVFLKTPL